jgi:hypothetical protein
MIDHVVMHHQNQTWTNGIWGHVRLHWAIRVINRDKSDDLKPLLQSPDCSINLWCRDSAPPQAICRLLALSVWWQQLGSNKEQWVINNSREEWRWFWWWWMSAVAQAGCSVFSCVEEYSDLIAVLWNAFNMTSEYIYCTASSWVPSCQF